MASIECQALSIGEFRPLPLGEQVRDVLRDRTISGEPDLGAQPTETDLASRPKASRSPFREAMNASAGRVIKSNSPIPARFCRVRNIAGPHHHRTSQRVLQTDRVIPPSTRMFWPVIYAPASEARNATTPPTSVSDFP